MGQEFPGQICCPPQNHFWRKPPQWSPPPQDWEVRSYTSSHSSFPSSAFSAVTWGGGEHAASSAASTRPMRSMPHSPALHHTHKPPLEMPTASEAAAIKPDNPVQGRPPMLVRKPKMAAKFLTRHSRSRSRRQGKALQENSPQLLESEAPPEPVRVREPLQVTHVTRRPPPTPPVLENHPCFRNYQGVHTGPRFFPWGTTPGFAESYCKLMGGDEARSEGGDSEDREEDHKKWWRCHKCQGFWRTTGRIGWEESKMEEKHNQDLERLQKTCTGCMGTLWKPHTSSQWEGRTPSPTGRQRIQRERWIFAGLDAPLWGAGEFRIGMIGTEEEPTMSSGEEHPPPTYITPSEDEMDTTGPRTPQIGGPRACKSGGLEGIYASGGQPFGCLLGCPPSLLREATGEFDLREGPFLQLPPPPTGWTPSTSGGSGRACPSDCHRCTA